MAIVGIPTPSPIAMLMMSFVERPDEDEEDELLLPPAPLPVPLPPLLLLLDGKLDDAVCVVVPLPLLVTDREFDVTDRVAVGPESATGPTGIVEVVVGVPGSIFPASSTWLQVNDTAAMAP